MSRRKDIEKNVQTLYEKIRNLEQDIQLKDFDIKYLADRIKNLDSILVAAGILEHEWKPEAPKGSVIKHNDFSSKFTYEPTYTKINKVYRQDTISNWYHSAKLNFNTQFTNGYSYPNTDKAISKPFAPAYIFLGIGAEYSNKEKKINVYISPLTQKTTLVLAQELANQGAFGVTKASYDENGNMISQGKKSRTELGFLVTSVYKKEVFKNIIVENRLNLYSDYINKFGNIDVDWQMQFDLVVNKYVRANIGAHLIYDDDIKAKEEINNVQVTVGPKVQLKQMLGIGIIYNFI